MPINDETAKWSMGERIELVKEIGDIKTVLARMEARDIFMAQALNELRDDVSVTKAVAYGAKGRADRLYWLGGGVAGLMVVLELTARWFKFN